RMFTPKWECRRSASQEAELLLTHTRSRGGCADNDAKDVAVKPVISWSLPTVTTTTPPASSRIAARKDSTLTSATAFGSTGGESILRDIAATPVAARTELCSKIQGDVG